MSARSSTACSTGAAGDLPYRLYRPPTRGPASRSSRTSTAAAGCSATSTPTTRSAATCASKSDAIIVSVNYRHAPEDTVPGRRRRRVRRGRSGSPRNAEELGGIPGQLAVCGWSAGANVAAVAAQSARDAGGPALSGQVLLTPVTDSDQTTRLVRAQRRGLRPHGVADEVVLGPLRRRGRPHRPEGGTAPCGRSVRSATDVDRHVRVRPAGRRGCRLCGSALPRPASRPATSCARDWPTRRSPPSA